MSPRRFLPLLLVLAATAGPAGAALAADNKVTAVNETDSAQIFQLSIDLRRITEGPVIDQNIAQAYSSCEDCRTIAIAVQVLLLMDDIRQVVPVNLAESINYECTNCESLAYAGQLVLSTGGKVRLTGDARRRIAEIEEALNALSASDASLFEIYAEIDLLVDDLKQTVIGGLVPVGNQRDRQEPGTPGGESDGDTATGTGTEADGGSTAGSAVPAGSEDSSDAAGEPVTVDVEDAMDQSTLVEPAPTATATQDAAPVPGATTPTTTAEPAPAGTTTTPAPAEAPAAEADPAPTTDATTTSEPAPSTTTSTTAEPAPTETTATTEPALP